MGPPLESDALDDDVDNGSSCAEDARERDDDELSDVTEPLNVDENV